MKRSAKSKADWKGGLEPVIGGQLRGWAYGGSDFTRTVEVLVDGKSVTTGKVDRPRVDLAPVGISANCGFLVSLPSLPRNRVSRITARVLDTGYDFDGRSVSVCPAVLERAEEIRAVFHADSYQSRYGLSFDSDEKAFKHYISVGVYRDMDPNLWFDSAHFRKHHGPLLAGIGVPILAYLDNELEPGVQASENFDPAYYLQRYPDLQGCGGAMKHFVNHGHQEGRYAVELKLPAAVIRELDELVELEPSLPRSADVAERVVRYPFLKPETFVPGAIRRRYGDDIEAIVCVPYLVIGGGDLYASLVLRAFQERFGVEHVLLVVTDQSSIGAERLIDDSTRVHFLASSDATMGFEQKVRRLHDTIGALAPRKIHNMNSHATWEVFRRHGRQLSSVADLYANMFCLDSAPGDRARGYVTDYACDTIDFLTKVFTDNEAIIGYIAEQYRFSAENLAKFVTLYAPCLHEFPVRRAVPRRSGERVRVLWCGRLARQKRPDRMLKLAELLPSMDFDVYGPPGDSPACQDVLDGTVANVRYRGTYESLDELDLDGYAAFLNTSDWDGLANILIQIAKAGVPLVSSRSGGVGELIDADSGWLVEDNDDMDAYLTYLRRIAIDRNGAERKAKRAAALVRNRHDWPNFVDTLEREGAFDLERAPVGVEAAPIDRRRYGGAAVGAAGR